MQRLESGRVRVELSKDTVSRLLAGGQLCAADLRCLDCKSKECIRKIVLDVCRPFRPPGRALAGN